MAVILGWSTGRWIVKCIHGHRVIAIDVIGIADYTTAEGDGPKVKRSRDSSSRVGKIMLIHEMVEPLMIPNPFT